MATKQKYLKSRNLPVVIIFVIWCVSLYATFFIGSDSFWTDLQSKYTTLNRKNGLVVAMMPILVLVLSGLISAELKAILVFWRVKNALPGHRVFTKLAQRDARIDMNDLRKKLGDIPRAAKEQNTCWFKLYKKHESAPTVENPHRSFLLARDLASIALIFSIGGGFGLAFGGVKFTTVALYVVVMLAQYFLLAVVARNHGNRLVCNVIVEHLAHG